MDEEELLIPREKPKIKRYTWSEESLRAALESIKYNGVSIRDASDKYGISSKTLRRRLETGVWTKYSKGKSTALLGVENEKELADYIISLESTGYIHNRQEIRKIAYDFAKKKGLEHLFDQNALTAGAYWLEGFLRRHPAIKVKEKLKKSGVNFDDDNDEDNDNDEENDNVEESDNVQENDNTDGDDIEKHENKNIDNSDEDQNSNSNNDNEEIYQSFEYKSDDLSSVVTSNVSQNKKIKKHGNNIGNSKDTGFRLQYEDDVSEEEKKFYVKAYPSVDSVVKRRIHCTVCDDHIGTAPCQDSIIRMHPVLKVTHCKKCHDFYNSGEFSKGEDGSELYCRWCGQGGEVYCCSKCPYVFCKNCIILNLTQNVVEDIEENENWNCFVCAPKIMWHLKAQHWALMNFIAKQKKSISSKSLSDSEVRKLMTRDQSTWCCGQKLQLQQTSSKRSSSSAKASVSGNVSDTSHEEITFRKRKSDKKYQRILPKVGNSSDNSNDEQQQPPEKKQKSNNNDEVVCTPDVLSMLDNDNSPTNTPQKNTNGQKHTNVQKSPTVQKHTSSQKIATVQIKQPVGSQISSQQKHTGALQQKLKTQSVQPQRQSYPQTSAAKQMIISANQAQQQVATTSIQNKSQHPPPLIIRNYAGPVRGITPTVVTRKTIVGPRLPTSTAGHNPVYHTINGFRIDLNSAAQHETFRLPNGKLIQVKRQNSLPSTQSQIMNSSPNNQTIRNVQRTTIQPAQTILTQQANQTIQHIALQQQPPQLATIRYSTRPSQAGIPANASSQATITATLPQGGTVLLNGATVQQVTAAAAAAAAAARPTTITTAATPSTTAPALTRRFFSATPLGQARSQLQNQIFVTMEICQYLSGKIQSLTNSNAYNSVKNYTDVNELYIHLSYLLTYAIARFKGIQDKCLEDMRKLGFSGNAESLQSGSLVDKNSNKGEDDDIEIVEPKTTCIDLDSDDEDASESAASTNTTVATDKTDQPANLKKELTELSDSLEKISDNDLDLAANFLAGMLEVELHEESCDDESTRKSISPSGSTNSGNSSSSLKTPRKKTTNKPNPLLKQMELQELERIKETDIKLKSQCSITLEKLSDIECKKLIQKTENEVDEDKKVDKEEEEMKEEEEIKEVEEMKEEEEIKEVEEIKEEEEIKEVEEIKEEEEIKDEGNKVNKQDEKVDNSDELNTENKIVNNEKNENDDNETESKHEESQGNVNNEILNDEKVQASIDGEKPLELPSSQTPTSPPSESINESEIENKNSDEKEEISLDSEFESGNLTKQDLDILMDPLCSSPKISESEKVNEELNEEEKIKQESNMDIANIVDEVHEKIDKINDFAPVIDEIFDIDKQTTSDLIASIEDNKGVPFVENISNEENNSNQHENETIHKVNEFDGDITMEDANNLEHQLHSNIPQSSIDDNVEDIATTLTEIMNEKCGDEIIDKEDIIAELEKEDNGSSVLDSITSLGCIGESNKTQDDSLFETISDATTLLESLNAESCSKFNDDDKNEFLTDNFLAEFSLDGMVDGSATNIMINDNIPCETDELNLN